MVRVFVVLLVLLGSLGCRGGGATDAGTDAGTDAAPGPSSGSFLALTYNVAGLPEGLSGSMPKEYIPQISPLLNSYDLVLVQEDFAYHAELISAVDHPYLSVPGLPSVRPASDGLNRLSIFPFEPVERVPWVACNGLLDGDSDCLASKGFSVAATTLADGVVLDIYNLHAEAGGQPADVTARAEGIAQLTDYILANSDGHALVVGGDFNLHGFDADDEPELQGLMDAVGLTDSCRFLQCGVEQIDRILFRSVAGVLDIEPTAWAVAGEFVDPGGAPLSDHEAIRVDFAWSFAGSGP